jgi:hypothetical protein
VNHLVQHGIDEEKLFAKGWGKTRPMVSSALYEEEHEINRRTTFKIINYDEVKEKYNQQLEDLKNNLDRKNASGVIISKNTSPQEKIIYQVQIIVSRQIIHPSSIEQLKNKVEGLAIEYSKGEDDLYRYIMGNFENVKDAELLLEKIKKAGYDASIIAKFNGKLIALK